MHGDKRPHPILARSAGYGADRAQCVNRFAPMIMRGPFNPDDALRFGPLRDQFNHFAFDVKCVAGAHRPTSCAAIKAKTPCGAMPAKLLKLNRVMVTAGFANEVDALNQQADVIWRPAGRAARAKDGP
jgi:hypothetical protein